MMRIAFVAAVVAAVIGLVALAGVSVSQAVDVCTAKGRAVLAAADGLDREPPALVAEVVDAHVPPARRADVLSVVLLDRLSCRGGGASADWMIERTALAWQIERTFSAREALGLTVSTMDTQVGNGALGLSAGARRFFQRPLNELNDQEVTCLVRKAIGAAQPWTRARTCETAGPPPIVIEN
jgi:hypothetical protein